MKKEKKIITQNEFFKLFDKFIRDSYQGIRSQKNGKRIKQNSVDNYVYTRKLVAEFFALEKKELQIPLVSKNSKNDLNKVKKFWQHFHIRFLNFLYNKKGFYDNYVGQVIKNLRIFLNYLFTEEHYSIGHFFKKLYIPKENIPIVTLSPEQLNYLIHDGNFNTLLNPALAIVKDIFIFGCSVGLRISDILDLQKHNLIKQHNTHYLVVRSKKTGTETKLKLPAYAISILEKYSSEKKHLLPQITNAHFNRKLKVLGKLIAGNETLIKVRSQRGKQVVVYKDPDLKTHYTLGDHLTSHTMRRTAITTMLRMGVPEQVVRRISGHAANSKEFFKYVLFSQTHIDSETDAFFDKLGQKW